MSLVYLLSMPSLEILSVEDQKWYRCAREGWLGIKVEDISPPGEKRERHFKELQNGLEMIDSWYNASNGPLFMGGVVSYADITVCSWLMWAKRTMVAEEWTRITGWHSGRWGLLMERLGQYEVVQISHCDSTTQS